MSARDLGSDAGAATPKSAAPKCEFPGSSVACWKCEPCLTILGRREAATVGNEHLISAQSRMSCRICTRLERYCQTDGQGRGKHPFSPVMTCESCTHMGGRYHGSDDYPEHFCKRSDQRRAAAFRSSGDFAHDFMTEFRKFYDASPRQSAELCAFFSPRDGAPVRIAPHAQSADTNGDKTHDHGNPENPCRDAHREGREGGGLSGRNALLTGGLQRGQRSGVRVEHQEVAERAGFAPGPSSAEQTSASGPGMPT